MIGFWLTKHDKMLVIGTTNGVEKKVSLFAHVHADSNRYIGIYCCSVVLTLIETRLLERIVKSVFFGLG